ncbi:hypothetical protein BJ165DRAFT_1530101 [Panaeolus papilionaceus]|nr:hypothetical protein BJ165DRAFT_1530101 [Panaeolus papilionaceus]
MSIGSGGGRLGEWDHLNFLDNDDLQSTIDDAQLGDVPWQSFSVSYNDEVSPNDIWFRHPCTVLRLIALPTLAKATKDHKDSDEFRKFRRQVFRHSLEVIAIAQTLNVET